MLSFIIRCDETKEKVFELYRERGYSFEKDFPNEYRLFVNPVTHEKVRVYYNGKVFEYR